MSIYDMHEYKCLKCKRLFENSLAQDRCPTYKCQSRQIKDVTPTYKGVTYSNIEWCMEDEGELNRRTQDLQGRSVRNNFQQFLEEQEEE